MFQSVTAAKAGKALGVPEGHPLDYDPSSMQGNLGSLSYMGSEVVIKANRGGCPKGGQANS